MSQLNSIFRNISIDYTPLSVGLETVQALLTNWAISTNARGGNITSTFGNNFDRDSLGTILGAWREEDFSLIPTIEVLRASQLNNANGAFSARTNRIYISEALITTGNIDAIVNVLLEEIGHKIDNAIDSTDALGDEGAIFAASVLGESLSEQALQALKAENDHKTITVHGEEIAVEQQDFNGDAGNNNITGTSADDRILGSDGNDTLNGAGSNDSLDGGYGNDSLFGGDGNDLISGKRGNDSLFGGDGNDSLFGDDGDDLISGKRGNDWVYGGDGSDPLFGRSGNDSLDGGDGNDSVFGGRGDDLLYGYWGDDSLIGGDGDDLISGDDSLIGGDGDDTLFVDGLNDEGFRIRGNDSVFGGGGNDWLDGGGGNDWLDGGGGNDSVFGGGGNDLISGGRGRDILTGRDGGDQFDYTTLIHSTLAKFDVITDFDASSADQFLVTTALAGFTDAGAVASLNGASITAKLNTTNFAANFAAQFTVGSRTFVAINDGVAGFSASSDAVVQVAGLTGTLDVTDFSTVGN